MIYYINIFFDCYLELELKDIIFIMIIVKDGND